MKHFTLTYRQEILPWQILYLSLCPNGCPGVILLTVLTITTYTQILERFSGVRMYGCDCWQGMYHQMPQIFLDIRQIQSLFQHRWSHCDGCFGECNDLHIGLTHSECLDVSKSMWTCIMLWHKFGDRLPQQVSKVSLWIWNHASQSEFKVCKEVPKWRTLVSIKSFHVFQECTVQTMTCLRWVSVNCYMLSAFTQPTECLQRQWSICSRYLYCNNQPGAALICRKEMSHTHCTRRSGRDFLLHLRSVPPW